MSSLAGALILPVASQPHPSHSPTINDHSELKQPLSEPLVKLDAEGDGEMEDLFGNEEDVNGVRADSGPSPGPSGEISDRVSTPEREHRKALEYEEEEEPGHVVLEAKEVSLELPNIPMPRSSDGTTWVIRMPNFINVDSKPFHPDTYMGPEHDDEEIQNTASLRERSMTIKLKVENTARWRWIKTEDGQDRRQSNSRIIRWSDGSLSLRLGKELFDIKQSIDTSGAVPRQAFGSQPPQPPPSQTDSVLSQSQSQGTGRKNEGLTYLVAQHKRCQVLQSEALLTGYMTLTPTGMQSETHRMLVRAVGQKHNKVARLRMAPDPTVDPEKEKLELMKLSAKKPKKKADMDDGLSGGRRKRATYPRKRAGHDVWSDDEDESRQIFGGSDEEDEDGMGEGGTPRKARRKAGEDDRQGAGEYQEDDFVVADSSEEDAAMEGTGGTGRRRTGEDEAMEEDPLDKLDAEIEQEAGKQRRQQAAGGKRSRDEDHESQGEMDVESEEDEEEEFKVRQAGGTIGRKKRAIQFEDEDE